MADWIPLDPSAARRYLLAPYTPASANWLGANYNEALIDWRSNTTAYTHMGSTAPDSDAWHLQFPDDSARFVEALAWESEFGPIARQETIRRLVKGLIRAHVPGSEGLFFFRQRFGGRTLLVLDDGKHSGRLQLSTWGDSVEGDVKLGYAIRQGDQWIGSYGVPYTDVPANGAQGAGVRSSAQWNASPYTLTRRYQLPQGQLSLTARSWLSDEDRPVEIGLTAVGVPASLEIGAPDTAIRCLGDPAIPGVAWLPDGRPPRRSDRDGSFTLTNPSCQYLVLTRESVWCGLGFHSALLVVWEGRPARVEVDALLGYSRVRLTWPQRGHQTRGRAWVLPVQFLYRSEIPLVLEAGARFVRTGRLGLGPFPAWTMINAVPAGMAAGAWALSRLGDPFAAAAGAWADTASSVMLSEHLGGRHFHRAFFPVRAAAWMLRYASEAGLEPLQRRYRGWLREAMRVMLSNKVGYDGAAWPGGWDHFNAAKACFAAWQATGDGDYLAAFERAHRVYTIDREGIRRRHELMKDPGGFDTYFGSLPMGVWGAAGRLDDCRSLLDASFPAGWQGGDRPLAELWHDGGNGPWFQDDANPEYVGLALRAYEWNQPPQRVAMGAFPRYDEQGTVTVPGYVPVQNPWFAPGDGHTPDGRVEDAKVVNVSSRAGAHIWRVDVGGQPHGVLWVWLQGSARVDLSPDGRIWVAGDIWSTTQMREAPIDLSWCAGAPDAYRPMPSLYVDRRGRLSVNPGLDADRTPRQLPKESSWRTMVDVGPAASVRFEVIGQGAWKAEGSTDGRNWMPMGVSSEAHHSAGPALTPLLYPEPVGTPGALHLRFAAMGDGAAIARITPYVRYAASQILVRLRADRQDMPLRVQDVRAQRWGVATY